MSRARFLVSTPVRVGLLCVALLCASIFVPHAGAAESVLLLPLVPVDVADRTAEAARVFLAGELEVRDLQVLRPDQPSGCEEFECALDAAEAAGARRVVYGNLIRLGPKIAVRLESARVGDARPFFRDQLTAADEGALDEALRAMAAAIARERPRADRSLFSEPAGPQRVVPAGGTPRPRLALHGGLLFPTGDSYGGADRLVSLRLLLQNDLPGVHLETTLPMAGVAWSGHLGEYWNEDGALDWTLFDFFAAHRFEKGRRSFHLGAGLGLHQIRIERERCVHPPAKVSCGGDDETTALTGDFGGGFRIAGNGTSELSFLLRYHHVFADIGGSDDDGAHGLYFGFGAVL